MTDNQDQQNPVAAATENGNAVPASPEKVQEKVQERTESEEPNRRQTRSSTKPARKDTSSTSTFHSVVYEMDPNEIRSQVEFYFSPFNLPKDDHMKDLTGYPENNPVPIKEITSFSRMRRFSPFSHIVKALKESEVLEVIDGVNPEIKRKQPLSAMKVTEEEKNMDDGRFWGLYERKCSVYVKGFWPEREADQADIEKLYKPFGAKAVRMRKDDKGFKGSVFVSFESEAARDEFLAKDNKPSWNGNKMIYKKKEVYCEEKQREFNLEPEEEKFPEYEYGYYKKKKAEQQARWEARQGRRDADGGRGRGRGGRGSRGGARGGGRDNRDRGDADNWRQRREQDRNGGGRKKYELVDPPNRKNRDRDAGRPKNDEVADAPKPAPVDKDGVPIIATAAKENGANQSKDELPDAPKPAAGETDGATKKRMREDDDNDTQEETAENKKPKTDKEAEKKVQDLPVV